jgi:hypothetical protein
VGIGVDGLNLVAKGAASSFSADQAFVICRWVKAIFSRKKTLLVIAAFSFFLGAN